MNSIKEKLAKLIDTKSLITIGLVITLIYLVVRNVQLNEAMQLLFSNMITMVMTYFFTKKKENNNGEDIK